MQLLIVAVGHKMPSWIEDGFSEYAKRMPPELRIELREIKPEQRSGSRTAATASPARAVGVIGSRRPLQVMTWRPSTKPSALTCNRSTDESTNRTVPPAVPSSPSTCRSLNASIRQRSGEYSPIDRPPPRGSIARPMSLSDVRRSSCHVARAFARSSGEEMDSEAVPISPVV